MASALVEIPKNAKVQIFTYQDVWGIITSGSTTSIRCRNHRRKRPIRCGAIQVILTGWYHKYRISETWRIETFLGLMERARRTRLNAEIRVEIGGLVVELWGKELRGDVEKMKHRNSDVPGCSRTRWKALENRFPMQQSPKELTESSRS